MISPIFLQKTVQKQFNNKMKTLFRESWDRGTKDRGPTFKKFH